VETGRKLDRCPTPYLDVSSPLGFINTASVLSQSKNPDLKLVFVKENHREIFESRDLEGNSSPTTLRGRRLRS
jgi:hypothetical protein